MKVFLSWSGESSKQTAVALLDWLGFVFDEVVIWMSASNIQAGSKWTDELNDELQKTSVGIICLSPDNLTSPWLLYEAGALSKSFNNTSRVIPYCIGIHPSEVQGPLAQFQGVAADKEGTFSLVKSINALLERRKPDERLATVFETWWPKLHQKLTAITPTSMKGPEHIKITNILCVVTSEFAKLGAEKDIEILRENFQDKLDVLENASLRTLRATLTSKHYEIVHLLARVELNSGDLIFDDNEKLKTDGILKLLQVSNTKLLVLATCDSLVLGAVLARHMNVISGVGRVKIEYVIPWEECFYSLLKQGKSLITAYDLAKATADASMIMLVRNDAVFTANIR